MTPEIKTFIRNEAKAHKINPVGKKMETLLTLVSKARGETEEVTLWIAAGNCVKELPGFEGIKPLPNRKEQSAGGKTEKKAPRRIRKDPDHTKSNEIIRKAMESDVVTLADICKEMGVEGRIARRKLRGSDIAKPDTGWKWESGHADIKKVRDLLK